MLTSIRAVDILKGRSQGKAMRLWAPASFKIERTERGESVLTIVASDEELIGDPDGIYPSTKLMQRTATVTLDKRDLNSLLDHIAKHGAENVDESVALRLSAALLKILSKKATRKTPQKKA